MRLLIAALWLLASSAVAGLFDQPVSASDGRLLALTQALQQPLIRASYAQSRQLRLLKQPLKSSGNLLVVPGQAVILRQQQPLAEALLLRGGEIAGLDDQGARLPLAAADNAVMARLSPVLLAMLGGDWPALEQEFQLFFDGDEHHWQIGLKPRAEWLAQTLGEITLSGEAGLLLQLAIRVGDGDLTLMTLTPLAASPLTAEEQRALAP